MNIAAAYDKTLYFSETDKYTILRMKTADMMIPEAASDSIRYADHLVRFTAVGCNLPQTDAISIEMQGEWTESKYGLQFQVESWKEIIPPTIEGILGYLSSGLLKGIGPMTAKAIVQQFGTDSLNVLEKQPERLLEIRGITEERLEEIKAGYIESTQLRDIMKLLAPFKVTPTTAMRIYEYFGPDGAELLRESFYRLCEVPGFGFERVDAIVRRSGGDPQDPKRIQGAILYALNCSRSDGGHLYMEAEKLVASSLQILNEKISLRLNRQQIAYELEGMVKTNVVVCVQGNIYLPHVFAEEGETASKVASMLLETPEPVKIASVMEYVRSQMSITLSPKQAEGVEMVFKHNLSIITGGPGTGKSTILKAVIKGYQKLYPRNTILLGAPTGKASRRMAETTGIETAQTLHSLLKLRSDDSGRQEKRELDTDFLIVDEASMIDMWLAHQLFSQLKPGTKVLLVGDADQLESVGAGNVFRELIGNGLVPVTVLDQIFRQAEDSLIAHNAKFINDGNGDLYYGRDFTFIRADDQEEAAELIRCFYMEEVSESSMDQIQILSPFRSRGAASTNELNQIIREEINPPTRRKQMNLTQDQLAELVGVTGQTISIAELGKKAMRADTIIGICNALNISADYLLFGSISSQNALLFSQKISHLSPEQHHYFENAVDSIIAIAALSENKT